MMATTGSPPAVPPRNALSAAPGPKGKPIVGSLFEAWEDPVALFTRATGQHGDVVKFRFGPFDYILLNHPDAIRHVLVENAKNYEKSRNYKGLKQLLGQGLLTSEGDYWRRQRKLSQPAFHRDKLARFAGQMAMCTRDMLTRWEADYPEGAPIDLHREMMRLTFRIVGLTLLSTDMDGDASAIGRALDVGIKWANAYAETAFPMPLWVPTPDNLRMRKAQETINGVIHRVIDERRASGKDEPDLLGMLMNVKDEATGESMSDVQLRDELVTLVLAGHETTANALAFTFYLLSRHPDVGARLREEVVRVLGDREPTLADLPKLTYTKMILEEAMRLFPPAWAFERQALEEDQVQGYRIPKDAIIGVCTYTMHRHPRYWENPEGFDPTRFSPEKSEARVRYTYLPFGGGQRMCIGNGFAMMEMQLVLAMIASRTRLDLVPGFRLETEAAITMRPKAGVMATRSAH